MTLHSANSLNFFNSGSKCRTWASANLSGRSSSTSAGMPKLMTLQE